jgi:hypothetical protein
MTTVFSHTDDIAYDERWQRLYNGQLLVYPESLAVVEHVRRMQLRRQRYSRRRLVAR